MIGRGRHNDIYLYEITEQDLLLGEVARSIYRAGNVLMFADKRAVNLGREFACADDLSAAKEFLDHEWWDDRQSAIDETASESGQTRNETASSSATSETNAADGASAAARTTERDPKLFRREDLRSLTEKIEQRDELLRDLSESLKSQQQVNSVLHAQLEQARKQLVVDELRQNEMVDDLQSVSVETHTIESTLERVMEEKFRLEEELAERITELVDLNLQNDDLRKRLVETHEVSEFTVATTVPLAQAVPATSAIKAPATETIEVRATPVGESDERQLTSRAMYFEDSQIITTASGKQIHIMHEFPSTSGKTMLARVGRSLLSGLRVAAIILFAVLILSVGSVVVTAHFNGIPYGAALDLILSNLGLAASFIA
ncbi:MAG: hypothetical protein LBU31_00745 [Coriobacteriales bacterium]|jgi:hypothetical protein|nr:hypothetical protein [Coriobacteriales bacterium]